MDDTHLKDNEPEKKNFYKGHNYDFDDNDIDDIFDQRRRNIEEDFHNQEKEDCQCHYIWQDDLGFVNYDNEQLEEVVVECPNDYYFKYWSEYQYHENESDLYCKCLDGLI